MIPKKNIKKQGTNKPTKKKTAKSRSVIHKNIPQAIAKKKHTQYQKTSSSKKTQSTYTKHFSLLYGWFTYGNFISGLEPFLLEKEVVALFHSLQKKYKHLQDAPHYAMTNLLDEFSRQPTKKNLFHFLGKLSAQKGYLMSFKELLTDDEDFIEYLKKELSHQYFDFEQISRFLRNVYVHATDVNVRLRGDDFHNQRDYLLFKKKTRLVFSFSTDQKYTISLDFTKLLSQTPLSKLIEQKVVDQLIVFKHNLVVNYVKSKQKM